MPRNAIFNTSTFFRHRRRPHSALGVRTPIEYENVLSEGRHPFMRFSRPHPENRANIKMSTD
jgi:hypothetical protein